MEHNRKDIYQQREKEFNAQGNTMQQRLRVFAILRLAAFLITAGLVYLCYASPWVWLIVIGGLAAFLGLVRQYSRIKERVRHLRTLATINGQERESLDGRYTPFSPGTNQNEPEHAFAHDLDLFGPRSVFQWLNRTTTDFGETALAQTFLHPNLDPKTITSRQEAVKALAPAVDWRQELRAIGLQNLEKRVPVEDLHTWVNTKANVALNPIYKIATWIAPLYGTCMTALLFLDRIDLSQFFIFMLLPLGVVSLHIKRITQHYLRAGRMLDLILVLGRQLACVEGARFEAPLLQSLQEKLKADNHSAGAAIAELAKIMGMLDQRNNLLLAIPLNAFFLWDILYTRKLQQWQATHREALPHWIQTIAEFEALSSLATIHYNYPEFAFPALSDQTGPFLQMKQAGHPLLQKKVRIDNDFSLDPQGSFTILTGANMAGKSTFLRTVGVNLALANAGAPVCATAVYYRPVPVFTSMRTTDSLQENESYFFTELKRLKALVSILEEGGELFIILDEILKGTNSKDKEQGSRAFLEKLLTLKATGLIATHDLSLCTLADEHPQRINNRCFEIEIDGPNIHFDYALRAGVCQNLNATFLMEQMGITTKTQHA